MKYLAFALLAFVSIDQAIAALPELPDNEAEIRPYANGSGPSAIFRLGRIDSEKADIFGIIDPIRWRIQYYRLKDMSTDPGAPVFRDRWQKVGSCRLAPTFRIWRVHEFADRVVLQSQPFVPEKAFIYPAGTKPLDLSFSKLTLDASPAALASIETRDATPDAKIPEERCATESAPQPFTRADAETSVTGGATSPFIVNRLPTAVARPFDSKSFKLYYGGRYLSSAQELEGATSVSSNNPIRHFLLTTRLDVPGFVATETVLIRKSETTGLDNVMTINLGLGRVKLGQRPIAVSSVGEVLILAASDKSGFRVHQCAFWKPANNWCSIDGAAAGDPPADSGPGSNSIVANDKADAPMWIAAFDYTDREFVVNIGALPDACVALMDACDVDKVGWAPLPEFRGGKQTTVTRRGFPYGQISERPALAADAINTDLGMSAGSKSVNLTGSVDGKPVVFGDIFNNAMVDPDVATVFGIDCSGFISMLWHLDSKLDTGNFITFGNARTNSIDRVESMMVTGIGDAFVINIAVPVKGKEPIHYLNHIVLFRETRASGPTDSSGAILVAESSASCGGACWSFYDESFFSGWGILRHRQAKVHEKIELDIPTTVADWQKIFAPTAPH